MHELMGKRVLVFEFLFTQSNDMSVEEYARLKQMTRLNGQ
jgi:hypothetical protein